MIVVDSIFSVVANSSKLSVVSFLDEGSRLSRFNLLMLKPQTYTVNMVEATEVHWEVVVLGSGGSSSCSTGLGGDLLSFLLQHRLIWCLKTEGCWILVSSLLLVLAVSSDIFLPRRQL